MRNFAAVICLISIIPFSVQAGVDQDVDVRKVQRVLTMLCYKPGPIDGLWGNRTANAVAEFLADEKKEYDGNLNKSEAEFIFARAAVINGLGKSKKCKSAASQQNNKPSSAVTIFPNQIKLPDNLKSQPNDATINYYIQYQDRWMRQQPFHKIYPAKQPRKITSSLEKHAFAQKSLRDSSLLSYLYMENGVLIYDELPPKDRFKTDVDFNTYLPSHSMGKSIVSYLIGHAICQGYIESIEAPLNDWKAIQSTLYFDQPLINLLNMRAGDAQIIDQNGGNFRNSGRSIFDTPLILAVNNERELKNTKPISNAKFSYSNLNSNILANYLMFKIGDDFDIFMQDFYEQKIKNRHPIYHMRTPTSNGLKNASISKRIQDLTARYDFWATRYDYLRIAMSLMEDWQNETCEGKYLRELYKHKVRTNRRQASWRDHDFGGGKAAFIDASSRYAGQFWTDFKELRGKVVLGMIGYNGQQIIMDMDTSRIVVLNAALSNHYDTYKLGLEPLKYGRIR